MARLKGDDLATWRAFLNAHATVVGQIEAAGLLRREPVPDDRRGAFAVLTHEGVALLRRMWPVYARRVRAAFAEPLGDGATRVRAALERVAGT